MTRTPDSHHGELYEYEGIEFGPAESPPSTPGELRYYGGAFLCVDSVGQFDLRDVTSEAHRRLRQLIHFIEEGPAEGFVSGAYKEITPTGVFPTSIIWWESSDKLKKIVERTVTWTGANPTTDSWKVYATDGLLIATVTDTISYSGPFETTRTRTIVEV